MASLLIIGGTGFFGKSILDLFQRNGLDDWLIDKVLVIARNPEKLLVEAPELISSKVQLIKGDIATVQELPYADYVIHAAASTDASKYLSQGEEERKNIIMGTLNYCKLAPIFHQNSKIVFCSSGAVYGAQPQSVKALEEDMDFGDAEDLSETKRAYAYAKRDSETAIKQLGEIQGLSVSIARCFSFVGKYLPRDQHFAIGNFIGDALNARDLVINANREVYRSYMYADDLAMWLMKISEISNPTSPIYNVGSEQFLELRVLAATLAKKFNVGVNSKDIVKELKPDIYVPSIEKAKKELGLILKYDLRKIVEKASEF